MLSMLKTSAGALVAGIAAVAGVNPAAPAANHKLPDRTVILGEESSLGTLVVERAWLGANKHVVRLTSPDYADLVVILPMEETTVSIDLPAGRYSPEFLSGHNWNEQAQSFNINPRIAYGQVITIEARETLEIKAH